MKRKICPHLCAHRQFGHRHLLVTLCVWVLMMAHTMIEAKDYTFALIGKQLQNPFFMVAYSGCEDKAKALTESLSDTTIRCDYYGTELEDANEQAKIVDTLIAEGNVDGISLSVIQTDIAAAAIGKATAAGIPVVTFDSDAPDSARLAYMGTDNYKFGVELGKLLDQLAPTGGKYGVVTAEAPNVMLRARGVVERLDADSAWLEVPESPKSCEDRIDKALQVMWEFAADPQVTAIISVGGWPMWNDTGWKEFVDANRHIQLICGDSLESQIRLINRGYANALVGQLPYNMGELSVETLLQIQQGTFDPQTSSVIYGTAFLEILQFPLNLPPVNVDDNTLEGLVILGYAYMGIVGVVGLYFCGWTWWHRKQRVIVASQPYFLYMIVLGTFILSSAIFPLTFDDGKYNSQANNRACMSVPWLCSMGFTTTFCALFAKLWRVNKIFHNPKKFKRVVVKPKDVLLPYVILMGANLVVLITWTVVSPLHYVRQNHEGTDPWNRVISTYGTCRSDDDHAEFYVIALGFINFGVLFIANFQAYQARHVTTEFSESKYIAIIMASLLQALVVGVPVVFLVRDQPRTYFVVLATVIFMTCLVVLLVMFSPKVHFLRKALRRKQKARKDGGADSTPSSFSEVEGGLRVRIGKAAPESFIDGRRRVRVTGLSSTTAGGHYRSSVASNEDSYAEVFENAEQHEDEHAVSNDSHDSHEDHDDDDEDDHDHDDDDDDEDGPLTHRMAPIHEGDGDTPPATAEFLTARSSDLSGSLAAAGLAKPPEARPESPRNDRVPPTMNLSHSGSAGRDSNPESGEMMRISNFEDERQLYVVEDPSQ